MSTLATLRLAGVGLRLLPGNQIELTGADAEQQQLVIERKEIILTYLKAEAFGGMTLEHSALMAGIERCYGEAVAAYWAVPEDAKRLIFLLDTVLADPWDRPRPLKEALEKYLELLPEMKELVANLNEQRKNSLIGRDLEAATTRIFAKRKQLDAGAFL